MPNLNYFETPDDRIEVEGVIYDIDMRTDTCLRFVQLMADDGVRFESKVSIGLLLMLDNDLLEVQPENRIMTLLALYEHVIGDTPEPLRDRAGNVVEIKDKKRVTDFEQDIDFIYAAFVQVYGIDIFDHRDMDYRKFKALLEGLPQGTHYADVIKIRQANPKDYLEKDRMDIMRMQKHYEIKG